jgi:hypothetical protein
MTTTMTKRPTGAHAGMRPCDEALPGIVISRTPDCARTAHPRITAFVWGGRVQPEPTLPYGRARRPA